MSSTKTDPTLVLDTGSSGVMAVAFHPDGKHILGGGRGGIRRWRLEDGQELGKQTGMMLNAISISRDHQWIVCGTAKGVSVWDAELQGKVIHVDGGDAVYGVDVSPDSTTFATGIGEAVSTRRITSGERLVGPLKHDSLVTGVGFSPDGERIAASSSGGSIRVFDGRNGDQLITIEIVMPSSGSSTPLAWSNNGQQIYAASKDKKIMLFDVSMGLQLAESQTLNGNFADSIVLAAHGKFVATFTDRTISFLDTSTLSHINPVIEDSGIMWAIAISPDNGYLATGLIDGKISIRDLGGILPDSCGPFHTSNREEGQLDEQPSTSSGRDNRPSNSSTESPRKSNTLESDIRSKDGDEDLLEVEVPSGAPATEFDFDEPPSPVSSARREDEVPPLEVSPAAAQLSSDVIPVIYPPVTRAEEHPDTTESSHGITRFKKWVQMRTKKSNKDPTSHKPDRVARKSRRPGDGQPRSQSPAREDPTHQGPSWMAAGQRVPRMVATSPGEPEPIFSSSLFTRIRHALQPKSPVEGAHASHANEDGSRTGQDTANPEEVGPMQPANVTSHPSAGVVHLTRESGRATLEGNLRFSITFPGWMCCGPGTGDGTH